MFQVVTCSHVDAVENAEIAEIKRPVFRALTRLRAAMSFPGRGVRPRPPMGRLGLSISTDGPGDNRDV